MRVVIGEGSCGIAAGASKVHKAIEALMAENESFIVGVKEMGADVVVGVEQYIDTGFFCFNGQCRRS